MLSVHGCVVRLVDKHNNPLQQPRDAAPRSDGHVKDTKSTCISARHGRKFGVSVRFDRRFKLYGAHGVKLVISCGHRRPVYCDLRDTQAWFIPEEALYTDHVFDFFAEWKTIHDSGMTCRPLVMPKPAGREELGGVEEDWSTSFFANRGSIAVFIQRGSLTGEEQDRATYLTDPPSDLRAGIRNNLGVIRWDWFAGGENGNMLYSFEFQDLDPSALKSIGVSAQHDVDDFLGRGLRTCSGRLPGSLIESDSDECSDDDEEQEEEEEEEDATDSDDDEDEKGEEDTNEIDEIEKGKEYDDDDDIADDNEAIWQAAYDEVFNDSTYVEGRRRDSPTDPRGHYEDSADNSNDGDTESDGYEPPSKRQRFSAPSKSLSYSRSEKSTQHTASSVEYDEEPDLRNTPRSQKTRDTSSASVQRQRGIPRLDTESTATARKESQKRGVDQAPAGPTQLPSTTSRRSAHETKIAPRQSSTVNEDSGADARRAGNRSIPPPIETVSGGTTPGKAGPTPDHSTTSRKTSLDDDPKYLELQLESGELHLKNARFREALYTAEERDKGKEDLEDDLGLIDLRLASGAVAADNARLRAKIYAVESQKNEDLLVLDYGYIKLQLACGEIEHKNAEIRRRRFAVSVSKPDLQN